MEYSNLSDLIEAKLQDPPEEILRQIRAYFVTMGARARAGEITEEEFYLATFFCPVFGQYSTFSKLLKAKNGTAVNLKLTRDSAELQDAWREWKRTGAVRIPPKVAGHITHFGTLRDSVEWLFTVIDVCKIPISAFSVISVEKVGAFPHVIRETTNDTLKYVLDYSCPDITLLLREPAPEGKDFVLRLEDGIVANVTVEKTCTTEDRVRHFDCIGTITDYVETPQRIEIAYDFDRTRKSPLYWRGDTQVSFAEIKASPWKIRTFALVHPIPHSKWERYNLICTERAIRLETEYRILRLPYLMYSSDAEKGEAPPAVRREGNLIRLFPQNPPQE